MRSGTGAVVAVLMVLLGGACAVPEGSREPPPNFVVIVIDTLRADSLGVYGYDRPTSPNIDLLAEEGVVFTRAFAHSTWTKPSVATLFTSTYPPRHGLTQVATEGSGGSNTGVLSEGFETLAERLQKAGYQTGAVVNQVFLQRQFGFAQGFESYLASRGLGAYRLNKKFESWVDQLEEGPFFAYVHYLDVHWPYRSGPADRSRFGEIALDPKPPRSGREASEWAEGFDRAGLEPLKSRYDAGIAFVDGAIRRISQVLQAVDRWDDTVVVITSDHGEGFLEHDKIQHGYEPYREIAQIPLLMRLPQELRANGPRRIDQPVGLIDVMPTLLDLAGVDEETGMQGRSLVPLLRGEQLPRRLVLSEGEGAVAARDGVHTLMRFPDGELAFFETDGDPEELFARSGACEGPCANLADRLRAYMSWSDDAANAGDAELAELTDEDIALLEALGYL